MALVDAKTNERANRRYRRLRKRKHLQEAIKENVGHYNIIGQTTGFKVDTLYQVTWLVGGQAVGNAIVVPPAEECKDITADEWFHQYVRTIMFGFDIEQADVMVSEVINDVKIVS